MLGDIRSETTKGFHGFHVAPKGTCVVSLKLFHLLIKLDNIHAEAIGEIHLHRSHGPQGVCEVLWIEVVDLGNCFVADDKRL